MAALGGGAAISLAIMIFDPGTVIYRGMSGVNYGLLAWAVLARLAASPRRVAARYAALLAALGVKVGLDVAVPGLVPSVGLPDGIALVGVSHAAGFYAAVLIWILYKLPRHGVKRPTARRPLNVVDEHRVPLRLCVELSSVETTGNNPMIASHKRRCYY